MTSMWRRTRGQRTTLVAVRPGSVCGAKSLRNTKNKKADVSSLSPIYLSIQAPSQARVCCVSSRDVDVGHCGTKRGASRSRATRDCGSDKVEEESGRSVSEGGRPNRAKPPPRLHSCPPHSEPRPALKRGNPPISISGLGSVTHSFSGSLQIEQRIKLSACQDYDMYTEPPRPSYRVITDGRPAGCGHTYLITEPATQRGLAVVDAEKMREPFFLGSAAQL